MDESELIDENEYLSGQKIHGKGMSGIVISPEKNCGFGFGDISAIEGELLKGSNSLRNRAEIFPN